MKGSLLRLGVAIAAAVLMSACAAHPSEIIYQADYPDYTSAQALYSRATLVVEARITGTPTVTKMGAAPLDPSSAADPRLNPTAGAPAGVQATEPDTTVITVYTAHVVKVVKGEAKPGQVIEIKQLGGSLDGVTYKEMHTTPFKPGTGYTLFLETYPDSPASLLNPVQAVYPHDAQGNPTPLPENTIKLTRADLDTLAQNN